MNNYGYGGYNQPQGYKGKLFHPFKYLYNNLMIFYASISVFNFYPFQAMEAINHKAMAAILIPMDLPRNTTNPTVL